MLLHGTVTGAEEPASISAVGLRNAFRVTERIFCGSRPEGDAGFAELARLGVKTIVSVDGNKPDLASARKYGLRYIHLPFGYDGVPSERVVELSVAAAIKPGAIYVHCRHGRYRAPAAVAVMCESTAIWTPAQAEAWLKRAGRGQVYAGLSQSVREFQQPTSEQLARVGELPEMAKTSALVDAMVAIGDCLEALTAAQKAGWNVSPGQPLAPAQTATMLWEQLRDLAGADDTVARPPDFRARLGDAVKAADALRTNLGKPARDHTLIEATMNETGLSCAACHRDFRDKRK